jgi:hypothetical protein
MKNDGLDRENRPIKNSLTAAERKRLVDLHFERGAQRQREEDLSLARAIEAAQILSRNGGS